jgi:hypothetical protein
LHKVGGLLPGESEGAGYRPQQAAVAVDELCPRLLVAFGRAPKIQAITADALPSRSATSAAEIAAATARARLSNRRTSER